MDNNSVLVFKDVDRDDNLDIIKVLIDQLTHFKMCDSEIQLVESLFMRLVDINCYCESFIIETV